jgi:cell division protein FtsB
MDQAIRSRDDRGRSDIGLRRKAITLASIIAVVALVVGSLFGDRGFLQLVRQQQGAEALAREIEELRQENGHLAAEIAALRSDPRAIERLAREELGLCRPGETVFLIREEPPSDAR